MHKLLLCQTYIPSPVLPCCSLSACFQALPMRGEHTVVPPLIAADPEQPCPLAQVGGRTSEVKMGAAPAAQCCYLGCALGVSRARWLGGAPHCCLVRCLKCHPAALVPLLCAAGPAAAAVGAQPPRPPVAGGRRRQLPLPSGADSRCGARAQAVAVPAPGGQGWWPVSPRLQPVRPMGRWHVLIHVHREPRPDDRAMFRSLP